MGINDDDSASAEALSARLAALEQEVAALCEREHMYRQALDAVSEMVLVKGPSSHIVYHYTRCPPMPVLSFGPAATVVRCCALKWATAVFSVRMAMYLPIGTGRAVGRRRAATQRGVSPWNQSLPR
jgi:hypothetical protein